jgi:hypothetical protein
MVVDNGRTWRASQGSFISKDLSLDDLYSPNLETMYLGS